MSYPETNRKGHYCTQFKVTCLGLINKVQKEKSRVIIPRHGKTAAELIPISAISQWEVSMLAIKGRLILMSDEESWFSANLASPGALAPLSAEILTVSHRLSESYGDPADRIIVATAITLGISLITADEKIIRWNEEKGLGQVVGS